MSWSTVSLASASCVLERLAAALGEIGGELFELRARELVLEVLGTALIGRDERQIDGGLLQRRQLDLRLFGGVGQPLHRLAVLREVDALIFFELHDEPVDDALVVVVAAQVRVAVGRLHFEDAVADFQHRDVERASAEVPHENGLVALLVEAVGQRGGGRLVDDAQHFKPGDAAGVFGGLALRVVKIRGDGDDRLSHLLAQIRARIGGELLQDHRRDLLRRVTLAVDVHLMIGAHIALDRRDRAFGIGDRLALGELADEPLPVLGECDDGRRQVTAFCVGDDNRLRAFHNRDHRVGGTEVDADDFSHNDSSEM